MLALGYPVHRRLIAMYTLASVYAGIAGALLAQTTQFVGTDVLSFSRSAELMVMLIVGGTGMLYGGLVGAAVFMVAHDYLSDINPTYWQFWLGAFLIAHRDVRARRGAWRLPAPGARLARANRETGGGAMSLALRTAGLVKQFGGLRAVNSVSLSSRRGRGMPLSARTAPARPR